MNPCLVCGMTDEQKPMCFRGENYCGDIHRKVLKGEYGNDVIEMTKMGVITEEQAISLWGVDFSTDKQVTLDDVDKHSIAQAAKK